MNLPALTAQFQTEPNQKNTDKTQELETDCIYRWSKYKRHSCVKHTRDTNEFFEILHRATRDLYCSDGQASTGATNASCQHGTRRHFTRVLQKLRLPRSYKQDEMRLQFNKATLISTNLTTNNRILPGHLYYKN